MTNSYSKHPSTSRRAQENAGSGYFFAIMNQILAETVLDLLFYVSLGKLDRELSIHVVLIECRERNHAPVTIHRFWKE
jgi:hypothetical protein